MDRERVLSTLRALEPELRARGVESMSLFGSLARGEPYAQDVDVAVGVNESFADGALDHFYQLDLLERRLGNLLFEEVDVVAEPVRKPEFQAAIDRDRTIVF
jgi:predicted nucleotidyltransferase